MTDSLKVGAAQSTINPKEAQFLFGYPHVERYSTGIHDPLFSSALYLTDDKNSVMFITNDIVFVGKDLVRRARKRIEESTGIAAANIMITATHTHSGPITVDYLSNEADPIVPKADKNYLRLMEEQIVATAKQAYDNAIAAQIGLAIADDTGIGTNRHDPAGPADHNVPVLMVKSADGKSNIACMVVCSMHPTVLHEDSKLISADFPGMTRQYLQENILGKTCPVLHHMGPAGNQSPRHVTNANTFAEAERLGHILTKAVERVLPQINFKSSFDIDCQRNFVELKRRTFPSVEQARSELDAAIKKLKQLREAKAHRQEIRTAECDWFGAEETLTLAKAAQDGRLEQSYKSCMPVELQIIKIGPWSFVGWQGEIFVDYSLALKQKSGNTFVISLANGELQGYIVTKQAAEEGGYEASNAFFSYESGQILVDKTLEILDKLK